MNSSPVASRARTSLPRAVAAAAIVLAAALNPRAARAQSDDLLGALKRVEKVRIEGNASVSEGAIRKVIRTGAGSFLGLRSAPLYRPDFLRADVVNIRNLYIRRGFLDATVSASADSGRSPGRVVVTYRVLEGMRAFVRRLDVDSSVTVFRPDQIADMAKTKPGDPFDPVQVALDRETIAGRYADRGHFPTVVSETRRDVADSASVDVTLRITEGPQYRVRDIAIEGLSSVDTFAVRRELLFQPGGAFGRDRMIHSTERLYDANLFTTVEITPTIVDSAAGLVDLEVRVRERKPRWIEAGVGTGTLERVRVSGQWGHRNLSGDGKTLTSTASLGWFRADSTNRVSARGEVAFVEPWFLRTRTRGRVGVSAERAFVPFADRTYLQEAAGLSFGVSRDFFGAKSRVSATIDNIWTTSSVFEQAEGDTTEPSFVAPFVRRITLAFDQDRRDDPINPRDGFIANVTAQLGSASRGSSGRYLKTEGSFGRHFPIGRRTSFGARGRVGRIGPWGDWGIGEDATLARVPITDRYRIGGGSTVRGYHDNGIDAGGESGLLMIVTNFELRTPLKGALGLTWFIDGGNVWRHVSDFKPKQLIVASGVDGTNALYDYHWSAGLGLRYQSPVGPIRLEYGRRLREDESDRIYGRKPNRGLVHFSFGSQF